MQIGAHVDQSDPVTQARAIGADIVQIFLGDPQSWKVTGPDYPGGAEALRAATEEAGIDVYVHAPYVINVASPNNRIRIPSRKQLQGVVHEAAKVGAKGVVVHGGHVTAGTDLAVGYDNWRKAIDQLDAPVPIFIENTAGGEHSMARRLESIARLWDAVGQADGGDAVGFCLDTCHAWAGGIDLADAVEQVRGITGRVDLVHANNSRDAFDSGADRHANVVAGEIPPEAIAGVIRDAGTPAICETHRDMGPDITYLRSQLG
ncbi:Xylose isomerase domain protein TIM barrel [Beutenbergia cavernae DSM 12333]|uniref:Xylose isomerase domain protein TIM barrel n=1 Tax=Beutenbergia cavernae (strain ATCC BAA-8 / DSM 12333 / CCUG 43141 / JCM 11478 / NBRC 16432 / NCIMB 13614 / HKI 0122) TaxID=471853 RepID=C5BXP7_BEUC1|nr:deoxyribonuclease IV [Beutenbergia cavernae]ACQ80930.1 Xylose isomerase domain protein TIM barrel [Beutenbergia cavernae DSM 12333]